MKLATRFGPPNAIWMREMRQAARLGRTPWILLALTLTTAMLVSGIGGLAASSEASPASIGSALFQVFFSVAYLVVTLLGPAVAANGIASEREGRTWEAVLLTGLTPKEVTRGKFLAAYTTVALYVVVLAPVGALSFLFGGVTAAEVITAFLLLFLLSALAVAFGLSVSSLMTSLRGALVVTLLLAMMVGPSLYMTGGVAASFAIHRMWPEVPEGLPVWLPLSYTRAPFGWAYLLFLVAFPVLLVAVPAWFLYETTVSNLTPDNEDRSTGLKRWYLVVTPLVAAACATPSLLATSDDSMVALGITGILVFLVHVGFATQLFAFDPPGPSRRVRIHWERDRVGVVRRFLGPGLPKTTSLVLVWGVIGLAALTVAVSAHVLVSAYGPSRQAYAGMLMGLSLYGALFFIFVGGLTAWLRARGGTPWTARVLAAGTVFLVSALPWVAAAIGGVLSSGHEETWLMVAGPSPFYVIYMLISMVKDPPSTLPVVVGGACALGWGFLGLLFFSLAARRCGQVIAAQRATQAQAEAALRAEADAEAAATAAAGAPAEATHAVPR